MFLFISAINFYHKILNKIIFILLLFNGTCAAILTLYADMNPNQFNH